MFEPFPWTVQVVEAIALRGRRLFGLAARVLGQPSEQIETAGELWALIDAARHCSDAESRSILLTHGRNVAHSLGGKRFPAKQRSLSMLAALAIRDVARGETLEREGAPKRLIVMALHRLTGRMPLAG
jgi:15-cis-phytoene synthase